ncbi:MAG: aminodeoxychorismate/anthranilate synthase component II, partial [Halarsenatibacteraceae bacterium]
MILVIDNYDSFTYNLVHMLERYDDVKVYRNNRITIKEIEELKPEIIVISPGPGRPEDAGISKDLLQKFKGKIPILGVCLGHQCIGEVFGGEVIKADKVFHGKVSEIRQINEPDKLFAGIKARFTATRYHSLIINKDSFPESLKILAETEYGEIMALKHRKYNIYGLQFHPKSILTEV